MKLDSSKKNNHKNGLAAEELAANFLRNQGFEIACQRFKTKHGEIDIIAQKAELLVFVEVKHRQSITADDPISATQKQRIINSALYFLSKNPQKNELDMRFDSILVDYNQRITHIIDSWRIEI